MEVADIDAATVDGKKLRGWTYSNVLSVLGASDADQDLTRGNAQDRASKGWGRRLHITTIWHREDTLRCSGYARECQQG
jgi:hypothetical protein